MLQLSWDSNSGPLNPNTGTLPSDKSLELESLFLKSVIRYSSSDRLVSIVYIFLERICDIHFFLPLDFKYYSYYQANIWIFNCINDCNCVRCLIGLKKYPDCSNLHLTCGKLISSIIKTCILWKVCDLSKLIWPCWS